MSDETDSKLSREHESEIQGRLAPRRMGKEGKGNPSVLVCEKCHIIYFNKAWRNEPDFFERRPEYKPEKAVCPACKAIKHNVPEGVVLLTGISHQTPKKEIVNLIKNFGKKATHRDPLDRVMEIQDRGEEMEVFTTDNQLAVDIGQEIKRAFGGSLNVNWSHRDKLARVHWIAEK